MNNYSNVSSYIKQHGKKAPKRTKTMLQIMECLTDDDRIILEDMIARLRYHCKGTNFGVFGAIELIKTQATMIACNSDDDDDLKTHSYILLRNIGKMLIELGDVQCFNNGFCPRGVECANRD